MVGMIPPNHDRTPHAADEAAIGDVPPAIGRLLSFTSNERGGRVIPVSTGARIGQYLTALRLFTIALGGGAILAFLALVALELLFRHRGPAQLMLWGLGVGAACGVVLGLNALRAVPETTFVGE